MLSVKKEEGKGEDADGMRSGGQYFITIRVFTR